MRLVQKLQSMGHLTLEQRYTIQVLLKEGLNQSLIAKKLNRDKSVIQREIKRNCDLRSGEYKADLADKKCFTESLIHEDYSPEQIVGLAKLQGKECVSIERIYQHIWKDKKQGGKLYSHLRTQGKRYRKRGASKDKRGQIPGRIDIEHRPKIVDEKTRFGDLEIDLVIGRDHKKAILTANDRATGKTKIALLNSKSSEEVKEKTLEILGEWKRFLHTITSDNGKEFALHQEISKELSIDFFFAKPYHSWERGANENYNGLLRQYFPKGYNFDLITEEDILRVEEKLNNRPRKRFGYLSPNQVFLQTINNNGQVAFIN